MKRVDLSIATQCIAAVLAFGSAAEAQCWEESIPWASEAGAGFGTSVAVSQDVVVVGAPLHTQPGKGAVGDVTVSRRVGNQWVSTSLPQPASLAAGDLFGQSVAINEAADVIVVGAPGNDATITDGGMLVIYEYQPLTQTWQIAAAWPGIFNTGGFGFDVDVSGDVIVVGEPGGWFGNGAVNAYRRVAPLTWVSDGFFTGAAFLDGFGVAVAVSGDRMVVGVPFDDSVGFDAGSTAFYTYSGGSWSLESLQYSGQAEAHFGASVDIDGDDAVAGAPETDYGGAVDAGLVRFYHWNGFGWVDAGAWTHGGTGQKKGTAVALNGDMAVVSSPFSPGFFGHSVGDEGGACTIYRWSGSIWDNSNVEAFSGTEVTAGDHYGWSLALSADWIVSGAPGCDASGPESGAAYATERGHTGIVADLGNGLAGTAGMVPILTAMGSFCHRTTFTLSLENALPASHIVLVLGTSTVFLPFNGGTLVPFPERLFGPYAVDSNGEFHGTSFWPKSGPSISLNVQFWVIDPGAAYGYAASNGLSLISTGG